MVHHERQYFTSLCCGCVAMSELTTTIIEHTRMLLVVLVNSLMRPTKCVLSRWQRYHAVSCSNLRWNYAFWSSCSMSVLPTASGLERGSKSANRLNHAERSLDVPVVSVKGRINVTSTNINTPLLCCKNCIWPSFEIWMEHATSSKKAPINTGFSSTVFSHMLYSFGLLLPFTAGLWVSWLAPDECLVASVTSCGMVSAQSEVETQIWTNHWGTVNVPKLDPANKSCPSVCADVDWSRLLDT